MAYDIKEKERWGRKKEADRWLRWLLSIDVTSHYLSFFSFSFFFYSFYQEPVEGLAFALNIL